MTLPQKTLLIFAAILCLLASYFSAVMFWVEVVNVRPAKVINTLPHKSAFDENLALAMVARLKRSIALSPYHAESHLLLARYYEKLHFELLSPETLPPPTTGAQQSNYAELAEQSYLNAITHQPTSHMPWARLANFHSQEIDYLNTLQPMTPLITTKRKKHQQQFTVTFWQSINLGAFEDYNQRIIIPLIFKHWSEISQTKENHKKVIEIINHTLKNRRHPKLALDSAKKYHQLEVLTPLVIKKWSIKRLKFYQAQEEKERQKAVAND